MTTPSWPADYRATDDFAVLNQGQLKTLATAAYDELQANLNGGAGTAVAALVNGWYNLNPDGTLPAPGARVARAGVTTAYTAVNLGQLKTVAQPFYDRLIAEGICPGYPWSYSPSPADDYAAANLGQAKNLFQFAFGSSVPINEYGLPDWFVKALGSQGAVDLAQGTNPGGPRDPNSDTDGDGLSNAEEYAAGTRYTGAGSQDSDGDGILDGLDGWPMNPDLNPPRVPNTRFAVLPLGPNAIPAGAEIRALGDGCQILYRVWANGDLVSVSLWTPAGTKVAGLLGTSPFPILSPDGNKLAGYLRREDVGTQGAVWNFLTNSATPLPRVAFPNAQAVDTWYESAVCVNDIGTAAGSTDQWVASTDPAMEATHYLSGALWEGGVGERLGRDGGNYHVGKSFFYPAAINNGGISVGWSCLPSGVTGVGIIEPGSRFKRFNADGGWVTPTLNNLSDPWVIDAYGNLWVKVGGVWKNEAQIATWGADAPLQAAVGTVTGINDRCEMIGYFSGGPKGKEGNLVRNGQVFNVNDLVEGYWVDPQGLMAINNSGVILTYVTDNNTNATTPALLVPVEFTLRDSGKLTPSPESSLYDATKFAMGGNDILGPRPIGTGRRDSPGTSYNNATEMVAHVIVIPGLTWKWSRRVWYRSWQIKKEPTYFGVSHQWGVGLITTNALKKGDPGENDTTGLYDDNTPSPVTGNIYSTDASGADLRLSGTSIGDFVCDEKRFRYSVTCTGGGVEGSSVSVLLRQEIVYTKVANSSDLAAAYRGIHNLVELAPVGITVDIFITKDKVWSIVGDKKDVLFAPHTNPE